MPFKHKSSNNLYIKDMRHNFQRSNCGKTHKIKLFISWFDKSISKEMISKNARESTGNPCISDEQTINLVN